MQRSTETISQQVRDTPSTHILHVQLSKRGRREKRTTTKHERNWIGWVTTGFLEHIIVKGDTWLEKQLMIYLPISTPSHRGIYRVIQNHTVLTKDNKFVTHVPLQKSYCHHRGRCGSWRGTGPDWGDECLDFRCSQTPAGWTTPAVYVYNVHV